LATVGRGLTTIAIVETEGAHGELVIVHCKIFVPKPSPVTGVVGESEFVIVPLPEIRLQFPVPVIGVFAAVIRAGLEIQSV
jgi:hypothetical protein